jgi:hypothetical protein
MKSPGIEVLGGLPPLPDMPFALHVPRPLSAAARHFSAAVRALLTGPEALRGVA